MRIFMRFKNLFVTSIAVTLLSACSTVHITADKGFIPRDPGSLALLSKKAPEYKIENIEFKHHHGAVSRGVSIQNPNAPVTVLYFMGSGIRLDAHGLNFTQPLTELNANIISFDYRGFGRSDPSENPLSLKDVEQDILAIYDHVRSMVKGKLIVHGHSYGSFIAAQLAAQRPLDALVMEGTGTSAQAYVDNMFPWFAKPFYKVTIEADLLAIDNRKALANYAGPILIINGEQDPQTPIDTARELFTGLPQTKKTFVAVPEAGHMNSMQKAIAKDAYRAFIKAL